MEELLELKQLIQVGKYEDALMLVEDLEEMGKKGIANNIWSFARIILIHLIKQQVENRTTKSWETSIYNSTERIKYLNQRPKNRGNYLNDEELHEVITLSWNSAVKQAAIETAEGVYEARQIESMVDKIKLIEKAYQLIK